MKKISTRENEKKKQRINKIVVGVILIGLMFLSTVGYAFYGSGTTEENGEEQEFEQGTFVNGKWAYQIGEEQFFFTNFIGLAENVPVDISLVLNDYYNAPLYIDSDDVSLQEIGSILDRYSSRTQKACYGECDLDVPEKKCDENLIVVRESGNPRVRQEGNCIFIEGDSIAVDAFLYKILGFS